MQAEHFAFLSLVLANVADASVDWAEVAKLKGIGRKDNAATAFKNMIKKYGLVYDNKKFVPIDGFDPTASDAAPATPKNKQTPKKTPKTSKRKKVDENPEAGTGADKDSAMKSPSKKAKVKKELAKTEDAVKDEAESDD